MIIPMADQNRKRNPSSDFCCLGIYRIPKGILDGPMNRLKSSVGMIYTARDLPLHTQKRRASELIFGGDGGSVKLSATQKIIEDPP
jgi:hypothetical protein